MARRISPVIFALSGIGLLVAVLVVDSARTSSRHATTTRRVMSDYAALGGEGVSNRFQSAFASRFVQVLGIMPANASERDVRAASLPTAPANIAKAAAWSGSISDNGALQVERYDTTVAVPAALTDSVRAANGRLAAGAYLGMTIIDSQFIVFVPAANGSTPRMFSMTFAALQPMLARFINNDQVLPQTLTRGRKLGNDIGVTLSVGDRALVRRGIDKSRYYSREMLGPMFANITIDVQLAERLAPALIIGGLPASKLPFILLASALMVALLATMIVQLRQRERLARLREDFVAGTSHELRTPLAQIRLFAETLRLERVRTDAERNRALVVIEREARRLEHLVENMLHVSRAERGALRLAPEQLELGAATSEILADFAALADKAGVTVRMLPAPRAIAKADPGAWRQIVLNLLDNAVRYGGRGANVVVAIEVVGATARLTVSDNGPGVPVPDRERIGQRFWRGEAGRNAGVTGTGIGLATVRELVHEHGGTCKVGDAENGGAKFEILLPRLVESTTRSPEIPAAVSQ